MSALHVPSCDAATWSLSGEERTWRGQRELVACDPSRHLAADNYRIAKESLDRFVGAPVVSGKFKVRKKSGM